MEFEMSNMKLNNAVEEALGSGEACEGSTFCATADGFASPSGFTARGAPLGITRLAALRINHAEDEHYGMRQH